MTEEPNNPTDNTPAYHNWLFTLVLAEVIFSCDLGIQTRRVQFVSKSDTATFPRSRLLQLQQIAATNVTREVKEESNGAIQVTSVEAVYLLGTISLGWMTEEEFFSNETQLVATSATETGDNDPSPSTDNVVALRPN